EVWSLFDPRVVPHFPDLFGEPFEAAYVKAEQGGLFTRQLKARQLYSRMMKVLAETGNGWMTFKDACNLKSNQTAKSGNVVHLSNLCTEPKLARVRKRLSAILVRSISANTFRKANSISKNWLTRFEPPSNSSTASSASIFIPSRQPEIRI